MTQTVAPQNPLPGPRQSSASRAQPKCATREELLKKAEEIRQEDEEKNVEHDIRRMHMMPGHVQARVDAEKSNTGKFTDKDGVVRWDTSRKYTKAELKKQREEMSAEADKGTVLCLTDMFINHGL